jgi:hypothetical protein
MKGSLVLFIALLALVAHSCKDNAPTTPTPEQPAPPQPVQTAFLSVVDSACIEAWLKLVIPDTISERRYRLLLNDSLIWQATLTKPDTLMLIGGGYLGSTLFRLSPSTTYRVRFERLTSDTFNINVDEKTFRTLDTTSQNYVWTVQTFGIEIGGILRDVCVINDSCIWAVGRFYSGEVDSLGGLVTYNALRYDGHQWHLVKLMFPILSGNDTVLIPFEAYSVFGFSHNDLWFSDGGSYLHWNGQQYKKYVFQFGSGLFGSTKMWGNRSNNLFGVNGNGVIMHYDGAVWRRMESGTTARLIDIYGTPDGESVWVAGYTNFPPQSCLLSLENGQWRTIWARGQSILYDDVQSVWAHGGADFLVAGNTIVYWHSRYIPRFRRYEYSLDLGGGWNVRGKARNNIATCGTLGNVWHYNGKNWKRFWELSNANDWYRSIGFGDNLIVAVGERGSSALIAVGRKQP